MRRPAPEAPATDRDGGLTRREIKALRKGFMRRNCWDFDEHRSYDGEAFVMATNEVTGTTVAVFGAADRIELSELRNDALRAVRRFGDAEAAASFVAGGGLWDVIGP